MDIFEKYGIILTVGIYAANDKKEYNEIKEKLTEITKKYEYIKQIHGFYVDERNKNIYFDLIIDFECEDREKVRKEIIKEMESEYPKYRFNAILDDDFSE